VHLSTLVYMLASSLLVCAGSIGQVKGDPTLAPEPAPTGLEEIVVTAQRRSEKIKDVPFTLSAMTGEDLKRAGVTNTRDLAAAFPGLVFTSQGPAAEPSIRGVSTSVSTPGAPAPIAIYVDGVYQSNQLGNIFDLPDVQRIEVLKGPQGTLYGRNATGGAILVTTLQPSFTPTGTMTIGDGAYFGGSARTSQHFQVQGFLSGPLIADKLAASLAASYEHVPGFYTSDVSGGRFGEVSSVFVRPKLLFTPTENVRILLAGTYLSRRDDPSAAVIPLVTVDSQYPGSIIPTQPWHTASELGGGGNYLKTEHKDVSLTVNWTLPSAGTLTSRTAYTTARPLFNADIDAAYSPHCLAAIFICITPYVVWNPEDTFQQELTFSSNKFGRFSFVGGLLYIHDKEDGFYNINPPITETPVQGPRGPFGYFVFDENVKTNAKAIYLEGTFDISDALTGIAGVRYSDETKIEHARQSVFTFAAPTGPYTVLPAGGAPHDHAVTPKVALRYALNPNTNLFVAYNRGFKSGVLTGISLTAPAAGPETIDSFEGGIKYSGDRVSFNASTFYFKYKDLQVQFFDGLATTTANAAAAKSYGVDLDGAVRVTGGFKLQAGVSWIPYAKYSSFPNGVDFAPPLTAQGLSQVTVDATGQRMLRDPKFTGNMTASYLGHRAWGDVDASVTVYHSASYDWNLLRTVQTSAYTTLNGQVSLTPQGGPLTYSLYGKNLTNKAYIVGVVTSTEGYYSGLAVPREIGLTAKYSF
jgi:iron complex outermembrane receptor protein